MLEPHECCLTVIDVQGKLAQLMYEKESLFKNIRILIQAAQILDILILWCQQCPDALGPTLPDIAELLRNIEPVNKACFSCCGSDEFNARLLNLNRNQALLCGIETHICVYQTALDLKRKGYDLAVPSDAVSSRTPQNKQAGLEAMASAGVRISSTEMSVFELMKTAEHPKFREVARLVK